MSETQVGMFRGTLPPVSSHTELCPPASELEAGFQPRVFTTSFQAPETTVFVFDFAISWRTVEMAMSVFDSVTS
jgi:hypothetical protein